MNKSLTQKTTDHSDMEQFSFSFYCDKCGKEWKSPVTAFEAGGFTAIENKEAYQLIWAQEHRTAFEQANLEAHWHFSHCSKCGKWVCDDCFDSKGVDCRECSDKGEVRERRSTTNHTNHTNLCFDNGQ